MRKIALAIFFFLQAIIALPQTLIPIPDTLSGSSIDLFIADSSREFFSGTATSTIGYNGSYLGPVLILNKGQSIALNVHNLLADTTSTHWHGLHTAPMNDGGPHSPIMPGATWSPSFTVMDHAATYWYHPHVHEKTLQQVVKGAAGMIIVRDSEEAVLNLPRTYGIDDIPLICQFQHFNDVTKQIVPDDVIDNATMVNGTLDPLVQVPAQIVRFRVLNASSHRILQFGFSDGRAFHQIAGDAGLLDAPVSLTRLRLSSGERAEILVDFSGQTGNSYSIKQFGTELPAGYPGGAAPMGGTQGPLDDTNFVFLRINVVAPTATPVTTIPSALTTNTVWSSAGAYSMNFVLAGSPPMSMSNFVINGAHYNDTIINFSTQQDDVMIWNITNQSMMAHPFHVHGNYFYITSFNGATPPAQLRGRKDVVLIGPGNGSATIIMKFEDFSDPMMPYMYHCHILSHEDNGMMGQFIVNPAVATVSPVGNDDSINIYFDPFASEIAIISRGGAGTAIGRIEVTDASGRCIYKSGAAEKEKRVSCRGFGAGIYIVRVVTGNEVVSGKIYIN